MTHSLLLKMNHRNSWFTYKRWWFSLAIPEANGTQQELSQHGRLSQFPPSVEPWMVFHLETWSSPGRTPPDRCGVGCFEINKHDGIYGNVMEYMCNIYIYMYIYMYIYIYIMGICGNIWEYTGNIMEYMGNIMEYMGHIMEYSGNTIHVNRRKNHGMDGKTVAASKWTDRDFFRNSSMGQCNNNGD